MIKIQRATADDADRLTEIAHASKSHWGYPERWIRLWSRDLTLDPFFISVNEVYMATIDGQCAGFCALIEKGKQMELEHLWVDPRHMGHGVGKALFERAIEVSFLHGATALNISSDPHAEEFYARMGAKTVGRVDAFVEGRERYLPRMRFEIGQH